MKTKKKKNENYTKKTNEIRAVVKIIRNTTKKWVVRKKNENVLRGPVVRALYRI
jgi:hypothetical protein